jgi:hypothetical protein
VGPRAAPFPRRYSARPPLRLSRISGIAATASAATSDRHFSGKPNQREARVAGVLSTACPHGARTLKIAKMTPILPALILAACQGQPSRVPTISPIATRDPPRSIASIQGIDLPTDASDVVNELRGSSVTFVARYYRDPASRWPPLSTSEAQLLSATGLKIVAVWEPLDPVPEYFSYYAGYNDGVAAYRQAEAVGQPAGSAIYFAVDFNAQEIEPIEQYFRGVAAGFTATSDGRVAYKIGVYGSGDVCDAIKQAGLAQYSWLSNSISWTGSLDYDDWNIRQGDPMTELSFNHDSDEARDDYGGFRVAGDNIATPDAGAGRPTITQVSVP